jgi:hypothetical protein
MNHILFAIILILSTLSIYAIPEFESAKIIGEIKESGIDESSGLAISLVNEGIIYTHNDGAQGRIFALDMKGNLKAIFQIPGQFIKSNSDFEDIAVGVGPEEGKSYIYLGDIGDNDAKRANKSVIRFPEPNFDPINGSPLKTLEGGVQINFAFDDGLRDCETLMLDPYDKSIILVSKREINVAAYRLANPLSIGNEQLIAKKIATLKFGRGFFDGSGVTGGDISGDGKEILIRDYGIVYYFSRNENQKLEEVLPNDPERVSSYNLFPNIEPQGEAICWNKNSTIFYTTSEIKAGITPKLSAFQKKNLSLDNNEAKQYINLSNNTITNKSEFEITSLSIFNLKGKIVEEIKNFESNQTIDCSNFENGIYLVRIQINGKQLVDTLKVAK